MFAMHTSERLCAACCGFVGGQGARGPSAPCHAAKPPRMYRASKPRCLSAVATLQPTSKPYAQYTNTGASDESWPHQSSTASGSRQTAVGIVSGFLDT